MRCIHKVSPRPYRQPLLGYLPFHWESGGDKRFPLTTLSFSGLRPLLGSSHINFFSISCFGITASRDVCGETSQKWTHTLDATQTLSSNISKPQRDTVSRDAFMISIITLANYGDAIEGIFPTAGKGLKVLCCCAFTGSHPVSVLWPCTHHLSESVYHHKYRPTKLRDQLRHIRPFSSTCTLCGLTHNSENTSRVPMHYPLFCFLPPSETMFLPCSSRDSLSRRSIGWVMCGQVASPSKR